MTTVELKARWRAYGVGEKTAASHCSSPLHLTGQKPVSQPARGEERQSLTRTTRAKVGKPTRCATVHTRMHTCTQRGIRGAKRAQEYTTSIADAPTSLTMRSGYPLVLQQRRPIANRIPPTSCHATSLGAKLRPKRPQAHMIEASSTVPSLPAPAPAAAA